MVKGRKNKSGGEKKCLSKKKKGLATTHPCFATEHLLASVIEGAGVLGLLGRESRIGIFYGVAQTMQQGEGRN